MVKIVLTNMSADYLLLSMAVILSLLTEGTEGLTPEGISPLNSFQLMPATQWTVLNRY